LEVALSYITYFSTTPGIKEDGALGLLAVHVELLIALIEAV
jgi:hypothetical protein